jgi:site-specific DNA-methyltransferase (adenine-specific)
MRAQKAKSPRNRTLTLSAGEKKFYKTKLLFPAGVPAFTADDIQNKTLCCDVFDVLEKLPPAFADLLIIDPPYNLSKNFHGLQFAKTADEAYYAYLKSWFPRVLRALKPGGSAYICGDWKSSACLYRLMREYLVVRNRITWQREKGRGAKANWKNASEDIWFGTRGKAYYFNLEAVKQKRRVLAPYRENGLPKDWEETPSGNFRLTHPGNFWDDISVPYWSMPENTDHPTQKPEKLIARLILASCPPGGFVFDPFAGSGTTAVAAKKLGRRYTGIEISREYCLWAEKRLDLAGADTSIQGYEDGVFWERNTLNLQRKNRKPDGRKAGREE